MRLALGTAQFGYNYGISNRSGQTPLEEVRKILALAAENGIGLLDTAHHYKESEAALGSCDPLQKKFQLVTKTPAFKDLALEAAAPVLEKAFAESLTKLKVESVYGLLFHNSRVLNEKTENPKHLLAAIKRLKDSGQIQKAGVSIYTPEEAFAAAKSGWVELVQAPFSLLDQRLDKSGALKALQENGIEIHVRSVFLQGLLFLSDSELPAFFAPIREKLAARRDQIAEQGLSPIAATFSFLKQYPGISRWVVGVNTQEQLQELLDTEQTLKNQQSNALDFGQIALDEDFFLNPANWKIG